jgi:hypothetical protein
MDALAAVAHQAGLSGIDLHALARVLDAAQRLAVAAERERCASVLRYWLTGRTPAQGGYEAQCLEHVLDGRPAPTGWAERA